MKKIIALITLFATSTHTENLTVSGAQSIKMPLRIITLDKTNQELNTVAQIIKKDLNFTNQFTTTTQALSAPTPPKKLQTTIKKLCTNGTPIALCLSASENNSIEWRLYDTMNITMIAGKTYKKKGTVLRGWAHAIADKVLNALTGNDGFFSSRITYCQESRKNDKTVRQIFVADFDGSHKELLIETPSIVMAPRWNVDLKNPTIFFSHYTDTNVQLVSVDMHKNKKIASNLDGITMLPGFSPDGSTIMYSASNGNGNCQLYHHTPTSIRCFTRNDGNNISPIFLDNDRICFCSDAQTKSPQLYIGNIHTGHVQRITNGGYCTSPSYCKKTNTIAYHKKINNYMQIMEYDCATKTHTQITASTTNKHETTQSPCGTYLLFRQEYNNTSKLTMLNRITRTSQDITKPSEQCSHPHWSACYAHFPIVT